MDCARSAQSFAKYTIMRTRDLYTFQKYILAKSAILLC